MCVINIPPQTDQQASYVTLAFPEKEKFMMGKIKYMIGASVLILLFTAIVLWLANWWLMKQKNYFVPMRKSITIWHMNSARR